MDRRMFRASSALMLAFLFFSSFVFFAQSTRVSAPADTILINGKIFTSDTAHPYVQALAIRGDRILAAGDTASIAALTGPKTASIDLGGRTVIPGINDAHYHLDISHTNAVDLEFKSFDPSWDEVKGKIIATVAAKPKGTVIRGSVGMSIFHDPAVNRRALDEISPDHPVALETFTGHAIIANSAALAYVSIHDDDKDPAGARFERFADGTLSGMLREYGADIVYRRLADRISDDDGVAALRQTLDRAAKFGITTIQDMNTVMTPERAVRLLERVPTPIRVRIIRMAMTTPSGRDIREGWPPPPVSSPLVRVSGTKWMLDGSLEGTFLPRTETTSFDRPLEMTFPQTELAAMLRESLENNDQLMLHIVGHPATAGMLQTMKQNGGAKVWASRRVRFEHGESVTQDLRPLAKELGIVVVQNPIHFGATMTPDQQAQLRKSGAQPLCPLLDIGIPLAFGSDGPMNPYLGIMLASTHPSNPSDTLAREQAVIAYTATSAYAEFAEKDKGTLEPGKLADLAVLSQDIFSVPIPDLPKTESVLTMVGGKVVYDGGVVHENCMSK
jgi:predicted amidohydrolase YtcJ